jgi:putative FmdB family regulatory protein
MRGMSTKVKGARDMPTYEYVCDQCGTSFERFQRMTDTPLPTCPSCGGAVKRLIGTGAGVILKGNDDYPSTSRDASGAARCGRDTPCCGRDSFRGSPGCES